MTLENSLKQERRDFFDTALEDWVVVVQYSDKKIMTWVSMFDMGPQTFWIFKISKFTNFVVSSYASTKQTKTVKSYNESYGI